MTESKRRYFVAVAPGFWRLDIIRCYADDGEFKASREPIVAWEMRPGTCRSDTNYFAHPVTLVWSPDRDAVVAILEPDGVVRLTNGTTFASEAEWLAHAADQASARAER